MKVPFSILSPDQTYSVGKIIMTKTSPLQENNPLVLKYSPLLAKAMEDLWRAISRTKDKKLTQEGKLTDNSFDRRFRKLLKNLKDKAGDEDFGKAGESAEVLLNEIRTIAEDLEVMERAVQIDRFDKIIGLYGTETMQHHLKVSTLNQLYINTVHDHKKLKAIEEERAILDSELQDVPALWPSRDEVIPSLKAIYTNMKDYAVVDDETAAVYKELVAEIKPIVTQAQAAKTRAKNAHEGSAE